MREKTTEEKIDIVKRHLAACERVVVLTGAGISAESGVPTFRGKDGLWRQYRATDLATPEAFMRDPQLVWEFYDWRRQLLAPLHPNAAHLALADLENRKPQLLLVTQNIDGLHQAAGSSNVLELHGNIWRVRCTSCRKVVENCTVPLLAPPFCTSCGAMLRPHVVWFGEALDAATLERALAAIENSQMMLIIGTSATVQPAASMGIHAKKAGAFVVEINLEATPYSGAYDLSILGKSAEIVPRLL
ncbi:MAG: NAD-dependent deacylase [Desulforhabdus sp.]|jgi:NAD-dependent deacetylase|nr:NAD-dependent deacylase [Desulforhabdus sp.]